MAAKSDYYDILGVKKGVSVDEIKKAYRAEALKWHPDKHKDEKEMAEKRFKEINEAYQVLSDPQKKSAYDQYGHDAFTPGGGFPGGGGFAGNPFGQGQNSPFTYTYTSSGGASPFGSFDFGDPFEIFEQFFGGSFGGQKKHLPRYSMTIDFMEAIDGVTKEVEVGGKKRKIKIPAGIDEGSRINFDDFLLSVNIRPHDLFERDGNDIYLKLGISYSLAAKGGEVDVPTVDGSVRIRIRPGTQPGTMMRLRGKGAPILRSHSRGDEYVKILISVPEKLTREQKELIEKMEEAGL
jgi:DnaJ-class molecular chaperone